MLNSDETEQNTTVLMSRATYVNLSKTDQNILVLGEAKVGKTALIYRYTKDVFSTQYDRGWGVEMSLENIKFSNINKKQRFVEMLGGGSRHNESAHIRYSHKHYYYCF